MVMENLAQEIIDLIESYSVMDQLLSLENRCDTIIKNGVTIILYKKMRITILSDSFIFVNLKLGKRLNKKLIFKMCEGLCCKIEHRPCMHNVKETINLITLVNIKENQEHLYEIIKYFIDLN